MTERDRLSARPSPHGPNVELREVLRVRPFAAMTGHRVDDLEIVNAPGPVPDPARLSVWLRTTCACRFSPHAVDAGTVTLPARYLFAMLEGKRPGGRTPAQFVADARADLNRDDERAADVWQLLAALEDAIERGDFRHHKDGSRCYRRDCDRAHAFDPNLDR